MTEKTTTQAKRILPAADLSEVDQVVEIVKSLPHDKVRDLLFLLIGATFTNVPR